MASLLSKEPVCRSCIDSFHFLVYRRRKGWFIESVWKPDLLFEFPVSKETSGKQLKFRQNIAEVQQTRLLSVMADEAVDVSNMHKETRLLSSGMSTLQIIFERSFLVSAVVENKQPVTQSRNYGEFSS